MNTVKLILTTLLSFQLFGCAPAKYDKNRNPCPPITYGIPECTDLVQSPELEKRPAPTQTPAGIRN